MTYIPWLFGVALVALVAGMIVFTRARARRRAEALERVCVGMGFAFEPKGDLDQLKALGDLPLFNHGGSRRARNIMTGRVAEDAVKVIDYQYTTGGGEHRKTVTQTIALFPGGAHASPDLQLSPQNVFHKIGKAFGYQDIDFESNREFSSRYLLRGRDETAIRAALHPDTLDFFAQQPGWSVEVRSGSVVVYRAKRQYQPDTVSAFLEEAHAVLRALRRG